MWGYCGGQHCGQASLLTASSWSIVRTGMASSLIVVNRRTGGVMTTMVSPGPIRQIRSLLVTYEALYRLRYHIRSTQDPSRAHGVRARKIFFCTRVLKYHIWYVKVPAHVRERNNSSSTIISTLRRIYFAASRLKQTIFSSVKSQVARNISLESPHHPSHTGQEMRSIGHVVPKLLQFK